MDNFWTGLVAIATAIVGVAVVAVLVSRNSQTPMVIGAAGQSFAQALGAAVSPVTGGGMLGMSSLGMSGYGMNGMIGSPMGGTMY